VTPKAWAALFFVGGIWGASFLFTDVAVDTISPLHTVMARTTLGAAFLWSLLLARRQPLSLAPRLLGALAALSLISTLTPLLLISWAQTRIESGTAAILQAMMPIFTLALAVALFEDERLTARAMGGIALGVVGVALLSGAGPEGLAASSLAGQLAVILATLCYAAGNILVRFLVRSIPGIIISAVQIAISAAITLVASAVFNPPSFDLSWQVWGSLLALGIFSTGFAYIAYYWLIEHAGSFRAALVTYIIPAVGVFLGVVVLDETVNLATMAGGTLIAAGVALGTGGIDQLLALVRSRQQPVLPS
jgi:drug/metabolite transporter (DMT)-like permease